LEHYLRVVSEKTGSLIATSARFGAIFGGAKRDEIELLTSFGEKIGIAFQLADDVIDIASDSNQSGKTPGIDLREGVPTLVTLQILRSTDSKDAKLKEVLAKPVPEAEIPALIQELRAHQALSQAKRYLHGLANESKAMLAPLPNGPAKETLERLCDAIVNRTV
jgi:heptaprenyl diphosphate synthase